MPELIVCAMCFQVGRLRAVIELSTRREKRERITTKSQSENYTFRHKSLEAGAARLLQL
jgi:hypothetical protein